jgi:diguanylate cyclase (GGDEF)-like protein/PAS domain S-box-containing protein
MQEDSALTDSERLRLQALEVESRYKLLFDNSLDGVLQTFPGGRVISANPAACAMLGRTETELQQAERAQILNLADPRINEMMRERALHGRARGEVSMLRANGEPFLVEMASALYLDQSGSQIGSVMFRDITEEKRLAAELQNSLDMLNNLAKHAPGVLYQYCLHPDGRSNFPFVSEGIWGIYEVTAEQVRDDASIVFTRLHPDDLEAVAASIQVSADSLSPWSHEYRVNLPSRGLRWLQGLSQPEKLADGSVLWHGYISDITARKEVESKTHQLAYFDALTGLPNRRLLMDRIGQALTSAQRSGQVGALMFIDLDNFKQVNDARGHAVGDQLLAQVAQRLGHLLRSEDTVARLGGDEFVVLACDLAQDMESGARHAMAVAEKLREALDTPCLIKGQEYRSTGSIGLTLFPKGGQLLDDLLREADTAMYRAKAAGRNQIAFYEPGMQHEVQQRLTLEQALSVAVAEQQLQAFAQTQVDAHGRAVGAELLLRWTHAGLGSIAPAQFIPIAEDSDLIVTLGDWVLRQACLALVAMQGQGSQLDLSVNVSPRQFHKGDFVARVQNILLETGAPPQRLIFEVTEGLLIKQLDEAVLRMNALVALGIRFSIDDFGTGYSSLAYLKKLPIYEMKIDRSFVQDVPGDSNDTAIVESMLSVARHMGLRVVAEGVETQAQADFLRAKQCDCLQGYLFAKPMPLADWLTNLPNSNPR